MTIFNTTCAARVVMKVQVVGTQVMADPRIDRQRWFEYDWWMTIENEGREKDRENGRRRFVSRYSRKSKI